MPEPTKIPRAFAASGDKNSIPDSSGSPGFASWQEGFPAITSEPFAQGGIAPKRADFNGIFNALSLATLWQQQGGFYAYDATTDYEVGNVVEYSGNLYKCITANGPSSAVKAPTDYTVWASVITSEGGRMTGPIRGLDDSSLALYGGQGYHYGAHLALCGKDNSSNPGVFYILADNGVDYKSLTGKPDGTLTWDGKSLVNNGAFNAMYFSQTSGSYTAPYTGVYRITLKAGGGGGGAAGDGYKSGGGGGGEGGTVTFYKTLTKAQSYPYVIGAGGAAAPNVTDSGAHYGSGGGTTSFNGEYSIDGGSGGRNLYSSNRGGAGGQTGSFPSGAVVYITPGQMGQAGSLAASGGYAGSPASGGGGGNIAYGRGGEGAYFNGGAAVQAADGKGGFILIEYAG